MLPHRSIYRQGVVNKKSLPSPPSTALTAHLLVHQLRTKHDHYCQHTGEGGDIPIRQHGCVRLSVWVSAQKRLQQSSRQSCREGGGVLHFNHHCWNDRQGSKGKLCCWMLTSCFNNVTTPHRVMLDWQELNLNEIANLRQEVIKRGDWRYANFLLLSTSTHLGLLSPWFYIQFIGIHVPSFSCVGTPAQLRSFLQSIRDGRIIPRHKARVCFDLDRALLLIVHPRPPDTGPTDSPDKGPTDSIHIVKKNLRLLQVWHVVQGLEKTHSRIPLCVGKRFYSRKPRHRSCIAYLSEGVRCFFTYIVLGTSWSSIEPETTGEYQESRVFSSNPALSERPRFLSPLIFP